jgi:S-adenosylmethionine synthetase
VIPWLEPDAKSQVIFRYEDGVPVSIEAVVLSTQHAPDVHTRTVRELVSEQERIAFDCSQTC